MRQGKFSKLIFSLTSGGSSPASDMLSTARGRRRESTGTAGARNPSADPMQQSATTSLAATIAAKLLAR